MSTPIQLAPADREMAITAEICLGCGNAKRKTEVLCSWCLSALPLYLREWITRTPRTEQFADSFGRAVQHLVDIRGLRNRKWVYQTMDELRAAGFRDSGDGQCSSIRCLGRLIWLRTPHGGRMPVDAKTFAPHAAVCLDPVGVVLGRIRRLQTPARRRGGQRRGKW
jgi:hypothetical protein